MPGFTSTEFAHKAFLVDGSRTKQGNDVIIKGGQTTGWPASGGKRARAGTVVVKESGDGLYYLSDAADGAAAGDINTAAVVTSAEKPDADWASKILTWTLYLPNGLVQSGTVTLAAGDDTIAEVVTALNADAQFKDRFVASDAGASDLLVITSRLKGNVKAKMSMDLDTAYGTDDGSTSSAYASGVEADVRVIMQDRDLVDLDNASFDSHPVATITAGRFDESELANLSHEAKAILIARGSTFE
ncbi:MAG TPA: hypothetical protein VEA38_16875 [Terriglobales bacterium]|nr:hypothetical protein [Terriglobales bacterium]